MKTQLDLYTQISNFNADLRSNLTQWTLNRVKEILASEDTPELALAKKFSDTKEAALFLSEILTDVFSEHFEWDLDKSVRQDVITKILFDTMKIAVKNNILMYYYHVDGLFDLNDNRLMEYETHKKQVAFGVA